ncbi:MAG: hypothetical protein AAGF12_22110 [Myxococcota bacterium]
MPAAHPFVTVTVDESELQRPAQRSPGVVAVVGVSTGGELLENKPQRIANEGELDALLGDSPLRRSIETVFRQRRRPDTVYAVRVGDASSYVGGLESIEAIDDITGVCLAEETSVSALDRLRDHVEGASSQGNRRLGYAMVPSEILTRGETYVADVAAALEDQTADPPKRVKSSLSRMVVVAARGGSGDAAAATMSTVHGHPPHVSPLLKPVSQVTIPTEHQLTSSEIASLSEAGIVPIIDPQLMPGTGLHLAEARVYGDGTSKLAYVDEVRTLDDIEFRLRAGLLGTVGDARITRAGLTRIKNRVEGILALRVREGAITEYAVHIPVLDALAVENREPGDANTEMIEQARSTRSVGVRVHIVYGPAVHRLEVTLAVKAV